MTTDSGIQPWRHAAWALLVVFVLAALVLYFAVAWQAHQHPLESSPWNDRRAIVTVVACVALCVLLLARQARLVAWRAFGSVLALLIAVGLFGGVMLALLGFAWVALVALAAGDAILALVARDVSWDALERVLYGWIVGFAAIGFAVFALALGGWLYRDVALGCLIAGSMAALVWWRRHTTVVFGSRVIWRRTIAACLPRSRS